MVAKKPHDARTHHGVSESGLAKRDGAEAKASANYSQHSPLPATIAMFAKNRRETVRVTLSRFEEIDLIDIRSFAGDDHDIATKKGISLRVALLPKLIECLQAAEAEARKRGLIGGGA